MKLSHKIKLIFARFNWWLGITDNAKRYAEKSKEYNLIKETIKIKQLQFIATHKANPLSDEVKRLKIELKVLGDLIG